MDMVCHAAEGMDAATELYGHFLHEQVIAVTISSVNEYRLTSVAAKDDMIECSGEMYA
jgi:hypothetical protein